MFWLAAWFPNLGLEVFEPNLNGRRQASPAVLVEARKIQAANQAAREAGVSPGSSLATAYSIAAGLRPHTRDETQETDRLKLLAELAYYRFSPRVCIQPPDTLLLEIRGSLKLFGGVQAITQCIQKFLQEYGHAAQLGVGHTSRAALTLAKAGVLLPLANALSSQDLKRQAMQSLKSVDLDCAGLHPRTIERLNNMGIFKIGALLALPRNELGQRFQKELTQCLEQLTGELPEIPVFEIPNPLFHSKTHLLEPIHSKGGLEFPMHRLVAQLVRWLQSQGQGVIRMRWTFRPFSGEAKQMATEFSFPRTDSKTMLALSRMALENAELPQEIMSVELEALEIGPLKNMPDRDLFGNLQTRSSDSLDLLDRLVARIGNHAVQRLRCEDDHRPEAAIAKATATRHFNTPQEGVTIDFARGKRPLWLLDPPKPANPRHFQFLSGPERIQNVWGDPKVKRDYFIALHDKGSCRWLFHSSEGWFQHGYFS